MDRRRVLFLVDFKYRDLPGLALVKKELEALGPYEGILAQHVPGWDEQLTLRRFKPHLVVFPKFLNASHAARAKFLKAHGMGVAVLPAEGTAFHEEVLLQCAGRHVDLSSVDLFFVWNEGIGELIRAHRTIAWERCRVAGVPRFDFYHPEFQSVWMSKKQFCERYRIDPAKPVVTWATNFGMERAAGNPAEIEDLIRRCREEGLGDSPIYGDIPRLIEQETRSQQVLTEGVLALARRFPEITLVIKIHPAEETGRYQTQIAGAGLHNVRVVSQEYIWDVLNATDIHLHRSCTTGIEAWFLGKPTVDLQFSPGEWYFWAEMSQGQDVARSLEELFERVGYYLGGGTISDAQRAARERIIENAYGKVDGQSALRHAQAIRDWLDRNPMRPKPLAWKRRDVQTAALLPLKAVLGLKPYQSLRAWSRRSSWDSRGKYHTPGEEAAWLRKIRQRKSVTTKRILLLVDHKYRDLPGLALLKVLLESQGPYEAILAPYVPSIGDDPYVRRVKPHLVVLPHFLNASRARRASFLKAHGVGTAVIQAEGTAFLNELRLQCAGRYVDLSSVDLFFIWNEGIGDLVRRHQTIDWARCVVAGVPRFDFYHPRFRSIWMSKKQFCERYRIDPARPMVTWATNFGMERSAGKPAELEEMNRRYRAEGLSDSPHFGNIPRLVEKEARSRQILTEGVLALAKRFPEITLAIKIHPAEETGRYESQIASAGLHNVRVVSREYIWDVLNATDIHLHRSCTTGIEAWFLGKPTVDLQFSPGEWYFWAEMSQGQDVARSLEELFERVGYYLGGGTISDAQRAARERIIENAYGKVDGQSALRHAQAIAAWIRHHHSEPVAPRWDRRWIRMAVDSSLKACLNLKPDHSLRAWLQGKPQGSRDKYFTLEEENKWVKEIRRVLSETPPPSGEDGLPLASQPEKDFVHEPV